MVRYTGPPADRQRGGQPPQSIYQTKKGQGCDKNSQPSENKGVISKNSVLFTATDEGDDGVGSVIDTTKVTSSTPADQPLHRVMSRGLNNTIKKDVEAASCLVLLSPQSSSFKPSRIINQRILINLLSQRGFSAPAPSVF
ncbi:hypothetical protein CF115_04630 [Aeromonas veronii]|uniref:hypothetical protein n=1 Tax=Aeromonas veronii TaxID=654 RepID=UPI00111756D6|nr:hypothetical protein [Aeromonas veronii]TNJ09207.1 hypothetical protein CF115_04630 [Aeromonas veronii]